MKLRFATEADTAALLKIYAEYIDEQFTFECSLPSEEEFCRRIRETSAAYPYLVCEDGERILGYAYAHRYKEREAYAWNAELSVYIHRSKRGQGLGRRLYGALVDICRLQGVRNLYGRVTSPNPRSEALHRAMGFTVVGVEHGVGYKCGCWWDMQTFERHIGSHTGRPEPIIPITKLDSGTLKSILRSYSEGL